MLPVLRKRTFSPAFTSDFFSRDFLSSFVNEHASYNIPAVNIKESDNTFTIEFAAPGLEKKDFNIDLEQDILTVSFEKETKNEQGTEYFTRKEFRMNSFKRSFSIPDSVDQNQIKASHKNGILYLELPKKEEAKAQPARQIKVMTSPK